MNAQLATLLRQSGWLISLRSSPRSLPPDLLARYPWFPATYRELAEATEAIVSSDEKAWLLTVSDYSGSADSAYAWNEWERQSLAAAEDDEDWKASITEFWDRHLPIFFSVKSGYAYLAIERSSLRIVGGREPEYEEVTDLAASLEELLAMFAKKDNKLDSLF